MFELFHYVYGEVGVAVGLSCIALCVCVVSMMMF